MFARTCHDTDKAVRRYSDCRVYRAECKRRRRDLSRVAPYSSISVRCEQTANDSGIESWLPRDVGVGVRGRPPSTNRHSRDVARGIRSTPHPSGRRGGRWLPVNRGTTTTTTLTSANMHNVTKLERLFSKLCLIEAGAAIGLSDGRWLVASTASRSSRVPSLTSIANGCSSSWLADGSSVRMQAQLIRGVSLQRTASKTHPPSLHARRHLPAGSEWADETAGHRVWSTSGEAERRRSLIVIRQRRLYPNGTECRPSPAGPASSSVFVAAGSVRGTWGGMATGRTEGASEAASRFNWVGKIRAWSCRRTT